MFGIKTRLTRNNVSLGGKRSQRRKVNLEWWSEKENLGDELAPIIYKWMLGKKEILPTQEIKETKHLLTVGSVIGMGNFNATIWGSGIHTLRTAKITIEKENFVRYDIRAVRGPITRSILLLAGYDCPKVYGDPAVLMPLIYGGKREKIKTDVSIIKHITNDTSREEKGYPYIRMNTTDYRKVIDQIVNSKKIISSSLHGIILAEAYGIPAVFLNSGMDNEKMKFFDWYLSTGRTEIKVANSLDEALHMKPMSLPNLNGMRMKLIRSFPYDLWEN